MSEMESSGVPLEKSLTGIKGLDEITAGGIPKGRSTLVCGAAGCGKTLMAMQYLVNGARQYNEPGVFMAFEENVEELAKNFAALGYDLNALTRDKKISIDHVYIERSEIEETGEYDLEGLFIRLGHAIDSIGAKRVVLDTIEALFSGLSGISILRAELRRLFRWLKTKGVSSIITAERGDGTLTRHGLEEYVADCVIMLDHRVSEQVSTRRMRVVKYRGSVHGTNEYPFLIDEHGLSVLPISSLGLDHSVSEERIPTGIPRLDTMLSDKGFFRGSSILLSGTAGTGKTSIAATFTHAAGRRGERSLYFAFEEPKNQVVRNMRSIGLDLEPLIENGLLQFHTGRPNLFGLEMHLAMMHKIINDFNPSVVVFDPITNFISVGSETEVKSMLTRLIDFLKSKQITAFFTHLSHSGGSLEVTDIEISSLMDTWLLVRDMESSGERNRGIYVLKSRGMAHSNQIRELVITDGGIDLVDVYLGPGGLVMGAAKAEREVQEKAASIARQQEFNRKKWQLERKHETLKAQLADLQAQLEAGQEDMAQLIRQEKEQQERSEKEIAALAHIRKADPVFDKEVKHS